MTFDKLWNIFTYVFRIFKRERRPEYVIFDNNSSDDEFEYEYDRLGDFNAPVYSFVIARN
jgi:hypothetical protein